MSHGIIVLKNYAEATGAVSGEHGRTCPRCNARLRRANTSRDGLCDPCTLALSLPPWHESGYECPACHGPKTLRATRCIHCDHVHRTGVAA